MKKEIAMGFDNSVDFEIYWDSQIYDALIRKWDIHEKEIDTCHYSHISTEREFIISILSCMKNEIGGNFSVTTNELVESFSSHFSKKVTLGGTGVRAAYAMQKEGIDCLLHITTQNDYTRKLLPKNCDFVSNSDKDSLYPHIIIQYSQNSIINANDIYLKPSRANRIIYSNDKTHEENILNPLFYEKSIIGIKILQIGCFESVIDPIILNDRITFLEKNLLDAQKRGTIIYQEMGCFHSLETKETVLKRMYPYVDICSMNEDELGNLCERKIKLLDAYDVYSALLELHTKYPVPIIVIHSRYWALAYGKKATLLGECLKSGITLATTRFRFGDTYEKEEIQDTYQAPEEPLGKQFSILIEKISSNVCCMSSVVVHETNVTTIGLGDTFLGGMLIPLRLIPRNALIGD